MSISDELDVGKWVPDDTEAGEDDNFELVIYKRDNTAVEK